MTILWIFPNKNHFEIVLDYDYFFSILVPSVLKYTELGKFYKRFLEKHPFSRNIGDKTRCFKWIYQMRKHAEVFI